MKEIVITANVNPLSKNVMMPVWTSRTCGTINESEWWRIANEHKKTLESLGYSVQILEKITNVY